MQRLARAEHFCDAPMSCKIASAKLARLQMMLSLLPFPPLPVKFSVAVSKMQDKDAQQALVVALQSLAQSTSPQKDTQETVVSSHAVIGVMTLFSDWCEWGRKNAERGRIVKDGVNMSLIRAVLDAGDGRADCSVSEDVAYGVFFDATKAWIASYLPEDASMTIEPVKSAAVACEDAIHLAMSHYAHAQGLVYSAKGETLRCKTHEGIVSQYRDMVQASRDDCDSIEARQLDRTAVRNEQQELAELYSKHGYDKLLTLCFTRVHRDSLLGHPKADPNNASVEHAKDLLNTAVENHRALLEKYDMKEVTDDLQVATVQDTGPDRYAVQTVHGAGEPSAEEVPPEVAALRAVVGVLAVCMATPADEAGFPAWASLAVNIQHLYDAQHSGVGALIAACRVVDLQALTAALAPLVSLSDTPDPSKKRIDELLLCLKDYPDHEAAADGAEETQALDLPLASEMGIVLRHAAMHGESARVQLVEAANKLWRVTEDEHEKRALEVFRATGLPAAGGDAAVQSRVEIIE